MKFPYPEAKRSIIVLLILLFLNLPLGILVILMRGTGVSSIILPIQIIIVIIAFFMLWKIIFKISKRKTKEPLPPFNKKRFALSYLLILPIIALVAVWFSFSRRTFWGQAIMALAILAIGLFFIIKPLAILSFYRKYYGFSRNPYTKVLIMNIEKSPEIYKKFFRVLGIICTIAAILVLAHLPQT